MIDYRLIVLSHGNNDQLRRRTMQSFEAMVGPKPTESVLVFDGAISSVMTAFDSEYSWDKVITLGRQSGFCDATARAWQEAAAPGPEYVFWLEHDFVFTAAIGLDKIAAVLDRNPRVQQMALLRQPVSEEEREHGGYLRIPARRDTYRGRETEAHGVTFDWYEHDSYWTTNPSLFRRSLAEQLEWPPGPHCEGKFGFAVKSAIPGATFGVWGDGQEHVSHIGQRDGHGY